MPRALVILVILVVLLIAVLAWLGARPATVTPHLIEKTVTLGDAGDGAAH